MHVRQIEREAVERVARVMGSSSAAAQALAESDRIEGDVRFYQIRSRGQTRIVVEKLPTGPEGDKGG